ncbi:phage tail protein [Vagococcus sp. DIV0080]|uniref:Phage tail protein n=1 Tax=Candidatus Vagococcus giribetii TaxID=2230876 RepID=A0ABS3HVV3_9ENTE|nr:phage tail protein [Vagococcus sp. DIV0080]MBO0477878.1 phage tail protein [Vagococcus sp. DIV0080]
MFRIIGYKDFQKENPIIIHEPSNFGSKVTKAELDQELNMIDELTLNIPLTNDFYGKSEPLVTCIEVYDVTREKKVFDGRVIRVDNSMNGDGEFNQEITCEGKLGYLHDSTQSFRRTQITGLRDYLQILINNHNKQCEPHKHFKLRNVTVEVSNDRINRSIGYAKTFETIKDKLLDRLGGFFVLEEINGVMYLDYLKEFGRQDETPIQIARNLKSASKEINPDDLATVIVPLGEEIETKDDGNLAEKEHDFAKERYTIKSVNNNSIELVDEKLVSTFGKIRKAVVFPNSKVPSEIKRQGQTFLKNQRVMLIGWDVEVIELGLIDSMFSIFEVGNYHHIHNEFISPVEKLQITKKVTNLINPASTKLSIGNSKRTLSQYQNSMNSQIKVLEPMKETVLTMESTVKETKKQVLEGSKKIEEIEDDFEAFGGNLTVLTNDVVEVKMSVDQSNSEFKAYKSQTEQQIKLLQEQIEALKNDKR